MVKLTSEQVNNIPLLKAQGKSNKEIASLYKVKVLTIQSWAKKLRDAGHNVPQDKRGGRYIVIKPPIS